MLLRYTKEEPRKSINHVAVNNLLLLAKKTPHLWSEQQVQVCITSPARVIFTMVILNIPKYQLTLECNSQRGTDI